MIKYDPDNDPRNRTAMADRIFTVANSYVNLNCAAFYPSQKYHLHIYSLFLFIIFAIFYFLLSKTDKCAYLLIILGHL